MRAPLDELTTEQLLDHLAGVGSRLGEIEAERDALFARRLELWQEARRREPPIDQKTLAAAAGVTTSMVSFALHKGRVREAESASASS